MKIAAYTNLTPAIPTLSAVVNDLFSMMLQSGGGGKSFISSDLQICADVLRSSVISFSGVSYHISKSDVLRSSATSFSGVSYHISKSDVLRSSATFFLANTSVSEQLDSLSSSQLDQDTNAFRVCTFVFSLQRWLHTYFLFLQPSHTTTKATLKNRMDKNWRNDITDMCVQFRTLSMTRGSIGRNDITDTCVQLSQRGYLRNKQVSQAVVSSGNFVQ